MRLTTANKKDIGGTGESLAKAKQNNIVHVS